MQSLAGRPPDAGRVPALLGEGAVADHEHPARVGERLGPVGAVPAADGRSVPRAVADDRRAGLPGVGGGPPAGEGHPPGQRKAGALARGRDGEQIELPEPIRREVWELIRQMTVDLSNAALAKFAPDLPPPPAGG